MSLLRGESLLKDGPDDAAAAIVLAHGAGAPMDSRFMNDFAKALGERGLRVIRFEFAYMAGRRTGEGRKPPPRAERVMGEYLTLVASSRRGPAALHRRQVDGRARRLDGGRGAFR